MKKFFAKFMFAILLMGTFSLTSCQEEFEELPNNSDGKAIESTSATAALIKGTSSKDGSYDNIVDGASCFAIQFPYKVNVNGLDITIDSIEDLELIEEILDEIDSNDYDLEIIFPVKITLSNYTEITINSKEELLAKAKDCVEGGEDDDIECIDFVYPIDVFSFNTNLEITNTTTVKSDKDFRLFFAGLGDNDIVGLDFPITLEKYDNTKVVVNSNAELAAVLESAKDMCDEDDDNDYNDDDFTKERLDAFLIDCPWMIDEIFRNNQEQTEQYLEFVMDFKENGSVVTKNNQGNYVEGTWSTSVNATSNRVELKMEFETMADFNLDWYVYELNDNRIKLFANNGTDKIILEKHCELSNDYSNEEIRDLLDGCKWNFAVPSSSSIGLYNIMFLENGNVKFVDDNGTVFTIDTFSTWAVESNAIIFYNINQELIAEKWKISSYSQNQIFVDIYNENELIYQNVLQRNCDENAACSDAEINEALLGECKFKITNVDGTFSEELLIDFSSNNIHVYDANNTVVEEGNWSLQSGTLSFNDFTMILENYGGDWKVIECSEEAFTLEKGEEIIVLTKVCS
ncbi:hypothetical protein [Cellulophaga omnivescoria]|uniref:hypothetical protein n=1 Tax=Cellulophaga omnivescoria TaxID=1888890 RepID=UPI000987347B|nr:hypothetical protein [Cellulophaga omnivescoria]WBU88364.1 hypothetical protein PBN93_10830 [Cellulophaga omnivescoria]WKB80345.1 hypothetical protein QYR09_11345 [Cellulophaga lytica]